MGDYPDRPNKPSRSSADITAFETRKPDPGLAKPAPKGGRASEWFKKKIEKYRQPSVNKNESGQLKELEKQR